MESSGKMDEILRYKIHIDVNDDSYCYIILPAVSNCPSCKARKGMFHEDDCDLGHSRKMLLPYEVDSLERLIFFAMRVEKEYDDLKSREQEYIQANAEKTKLLIEWGEAEAAHE